MKKRLSLPSFLTSLLLFVAIVGMFVFVFRVFSAPSLKDMGQRHDEVGEFSPLNTVTKGPEGVVPGPPECIWLTDTRVLKFRPLMEYVDDMGGVLSGQKLHDGRMNPTYPQVCEVYDWKNGKFVRNDRLTKMVAKHNPCRKEIPRMVMCGNAWDRIWSEFTKLRSSADGSKLYWSELRHQHDPKSYSSARILQNYLLDLTTGKKTVLSTKHYNNLRGEVMGIENNRFTAFQYMPSDYRNLVYRHYYEVPMNGGSGVCSKIPDYSAPLPKLTSRENRWFPVRFDIVYWGGRLMQVGWFESRVNETKVPIREITVGANSVVKPRFEVELPFTAAVEEVSISPRLNKVAFLLQKSDPSIVEAQQRLALRRPGSNRHYQVSLWVYDLRTREMKQIDSVHISPTKEITNLRWLPSENKVSLLINRVLHTIPVI